MDKIKGKLELTEKEIEDREGYEAIYTNLPHVCEFIHELGGITTVHAGGKSNSIEGISNRYLYKRIQKDSALKEYIDIIEIGKIEDIKDYEKIVLPSLKKEYLILV